FIERREKRDNGSSEPPSRDGAFTYSIRDCPIDSIGHQCPQFHTQFTETLKDSSFMLYEEESIILNITTNHTDEIQAIRRFLTPELEWHDLAERTPREYRALSQSQFPVFTIYAQKSCLAVKPCERAWCIDRVQGHRLQGHTKRSTTASSRQHCLELCLGERDFLCR
ncbi:hypothetical protein PV326_009994, partial [Microctonus aethiopoides]